MEGNWVWVQGQEGGHFPPRFLLFLLISLAAHYAVLPMRTSAECIDRPANCTSRNLRLPLPCPAHPCPAQTTPLFAHCVIYKNHWQTQKAKMWMATRGLRLPFHNSVWGSLSALKKMQKWRMFPWEKCASRLNTAITSLCLTIHTYIIWFIARNVLQKYWNIF